jgi:hypothetical protein
MSQTKPPDASAGWRGEYREATSAPHPAVKERVWRAMQSSPRRGFGWRGPMLAAGVAAAVAVAVFWPRSVSTSQRSDTYAFVATDARFEQEQQTFTLRQGRLAVSAWNTAVVIEARGQRIEAESAIVVVEVAGDRVSVLGVEGAFVIDGERHEATEASRAAAGDIGALKTLEGSEAPLARAETLATSAMQAQRWDEASRALSMVAQSSSLRAEAALLKRGELELRHLGQPLRALASFDEGDVRFPDGTLAMERSLSGLEAAVAARQWDSAVQRADRFLTRFPSTERSAEVRRVRDSACTAAATSNPPGFVAGCPR